MAFLCGRCIQIGSGRGTPSPTVAIAPFPPPARRRMDQSQRRPHGCARQVLAEGAVPPDAALRAYSPRWRRRCGCCDIGRRVTTKMRGGLARETLSAAAARPNPGLWARSTACARKPRPAVGMAMWLGMRRECGRRNASVWGGREKGERAAGLQKAAGVSPSFPPPAPVFAPGFWQASGALRVRQLCTAALRVCEESLRREREKGPQGTRATMGCRRETPSDGRVSSLFATETAARREKLPPCAVGTCSGMRASVARSRVAVQGGWARYTAREDCASTAVTACHSRDRRRRRNTTSADWV